MTEVQKPHSNSPNKSIDNLRAGIDTDSIYTINTNEFNLYTTIDPITTPEEYTEEEQTPTTPTTPSDDGQPQTIQDGDLIRATRNRRHIHSKNNKQQTI